MDMDDLMISPLEIAAIVGKSFSFGYSKTWSRTFPYTIHMYNKMTPNLWDNYTVDENMFGR